MLSVKIEMINATFLLPVFLRGLHVTSASENAFRIDLTATQARLDLSFKRILLRNRGHALRNLSIQQLRGDLRRSNPTGRAMTQRGWVTLHKLLPENLSVASSDVRVEDGPTVILLRSGFLSASEIEPGQSSPSESMVAAPRFPQHFYHPGTA